MPRHEPTIEDLEHGLRIDQNALEDVCREHPELFYHVAKQLALTVSRRDEAKQRLQETEAEVDAAIRHDAEIEGEKITEAIVKSRIIASKDVIRAQQKLLELNREVGQLSALRDAYSSRSYALRDMVQLYLSRYYNVTESSSTKARSADVGRARADLHRERSRRES